MPDPNRPRFSYGGNLYDRVINRPRTLYSVSTFGHEAPQIPVDDEEEEENELEEESDSQDANASSKIQGDDSCEDDIDGLDPEYMMRIALMLSTFDVPVSNDVSFEEADKDALPSEKLLKHPSLVHVLPELEDTSPPTVSRDTAKNTVPSQTTRITTSRPVIHSYRGSGQTKTKKRFGSLFGSFSKIGFCQPKQDKWTEEKSLGQMKSLFMHGQDPEKENPRATNLGIVLKGALKKMKFKASLAFHCPF